MDRNTFAYWSFLRDQEMGLYPKKFTWGRLDQDDKDGYLQEADYYLELPQEEWPEDILARMKA